MQVNILHILCFSFGTLLVVSDYKRQKIQPKRKIEGQGGLQVQFDKGPSSQLFFFSIGSTLSAALTLCSEMAVTIPE